ncbi:hypothetical protein ACFXGA_06255 [Actinosynnema sp. NPDC059335]|uniref:hypothetical protein n=1 Tax=Actinosynnema sp. NPDC059335 TaxID=3346804 RepID=UPI00366B6969
MRMVTAKVKLTSKEQSNDQVALRFEPDYGDDRNKEWAKYTPALSLNMSVLPEVAEHFEVGKPITLQFVLDDE